MSDPEPEVIEAAHGSSVETTEAIEEAARVNSDPVVTEALDEASLRANTTVSRLDWLRSRWRRRVSTQ